MKSIDDGQLDEVVKAVKRQKELAATADDVGRTALHWACLAARHSIVKYLLDHGAQPNAQDKNGWNACHYAAKSSVNNSDVFKLLLKVPNLAVNVPNSDLNLPLHYLARSKFFNADVIIGLINKGTAIDFQNLNGETALHNTCFEEGHEGTAKILIHHRANVNLTTA